MKTRDLIVWGGVALLAWYLFKPKAAVDLPPTDDQGDPPPIGGPVTEDREDPDAYVELPQAPESEETWEDVF